MYPFGYGFPLGQPPEPEKPSKWKSHFVGELPMWQVRILEDLQEEHKTRIGLEVRPGIVYGVFEINKRVTLFYEKDHPEMLSWILHLFANKRRELTENQKKAEAYVLNAKTETPADQHPENSYEGPEPLATWHPITHHVMPMNPDPSKLAPTNTPRVRASLPLISQMRIAEGRDPFWPIL